MDSPIYRLLSRAEQEKNVEYLKQAFNLLDPEISSDQDKTTKDIENFSQNLYVECAEKAINFQEVAIANRCIQLYFSLPMISNQFLARAYLCQFELLAPRSTKQLENLDKSTPFLYKAIDFSIQNKRYNFLVYNSSIIFWKYAREFMKINFKRFLCPSLKKITESLKQIDDADYEWRAFLEKTLIEAYLDNKQLNEANSLANELLKFIKNFLPNLLDEFFEFLIDNSLLDDEELRPLSLSRWDLNAIFKIEKLKKSKNVKSKKQGAKSDDSSSEENVLAELNEIYKILLPKKKPKSESEFISSGSDLFSKKEDYSTIYKRQRLLLNLAHLCLFYEQVSLSSQIIGYLKEVESLNDELSIEIEFIECEQVIKELKHKQERYTKNIVKLRTESINKCHEILRNALRTNNSRLIQLGCLKQWNFCLPLLQPGLRNNVRKPLQFVAECLETIDSMEWFIRCQIHFELAKCDEEIEQLQTAEQHLLKAIQLDDEKVYSEQMEHALKRLRLRAELYQTPERIEDQVAMILEQCVIGGKAGREKKLKLAISELLEKLDSKKNDPEKNFKGEINTRSLLLRAADLLAPNEFTHVLESESFKTNFGKLNEDQVTRLHKKSLNYENCVKKGSDHLNHRINEFTRNYKRNKPDAAANSPELEITIKNDYKERLKLWYDLSKIARKQQIWDVCRVSSRFCLLYDTEQYVNRFLKTQSKFNSLFDNELARNLAEAHFILAESLIQFIREEGIELFEKPKLPEFNESSQVKFKINNDQISENSETKPNRDLENDKEWNEYSEWLSKLCKEAIDHFLKGIQIGVELKESYLVCQGSAYIWNYLHHIFEKKKHNQILQILNEVYEALKKVGHDTEPELLVAICVALATGLTQQWLPQDQIKPLQIPVVTNEYSSQNDKRKPIGANQGLKPLTLPTEGLNDFKKALEICEYGMNITNGDNLKDVICLKDRFPLIKKWVLTKQVCQSPIKNFGLTKTNSNFERIQDKFTKCMVGVEILNRNLKMYGQNVYEIKEAPSIRDLINLIDQAQNWPDKLIELELWSNLAILAGKANQTENLRHCYSKSLELLSYFEKKKTENKNIYIKSQLLLSEACIALGEHLSILLNSPNSSNLTSSNSKNNADQIQSSNASVSTVSTKDIRVALRRNALNAFADATTYAANGENYEYVAHSARHYWNLCIPYLQQAQERATLYENLSEILSNWVTVYKFKPQEEQINTSTENEAQEEKKEAEVATKSTKQTNKQSKASESELKKKTSQSKSPVKAELESESSKTFQNLVQTNEKAYNPYEDAFDDLTLRCVLYACLFQITIDKNQYEEALDQMEIALSELPRTKHRLLIYRFKVITKSKLGLDVQMDLQKFREESEKNLAQMYRKVALSSIKHIDTINSYQRAIETLSSEENIWIKFEYILELAQFMFSHEYNLEDCIDLCEWSIDLLMFKLKLDKSRVVSALTATGRQSSKSTSKSKQTNRQVQSISVLPTIQDDVEVKSVHKKLEKNTDEEFENLLRTNNKESLFEASSIEWNKSLTWTDLQDIKQLECLIRANTILAQMSGNSSQDYSSYLLKAYYSLIRLLQQAVENAQLSLKEIQKLNTQNEVDKNDKKKPQDTKPDAKRPTTTDSKSQKKTKQDTNPIPQTVELWSQFELNEEIINAWSHDLMKKTGINSSSISEPFLLFYYLEQLAKMLNTQGYTQLLFPLYNLQLILVNNVFSFESSPQFLNVSLNIYLRMKLINLCVELNLIQSVGFHQQQLALLVLNSKQSQTPEAASLVATTAANPSPNILLKLVQIDPIEVCLSREQIYSLKQRMSQLEEEDGSLTANSNASFSSLKKNNSTNSFIQSKIKLKKKQQQLQQSKSTVKISDSNESSKKLIKNEPLQNIDPNDLKFPGEQKKILNNLHEVLYKDAWILVADYLIQNGLFQIARDYLSESLNACSALEDQNTLAKVQYLFGKIALFDCNFIEARNYASSAQKIPIDELFWFKTIRLLVDSHQYDFNDKDAYEKSIKLLQKAIELVHNEKSNRKNKTVNLAYIEAMLNFDLAEITTDGVLNGKLNEQDILHRSKISKKGSRRSSMHPSLFKKLSHVCNIYQNCFELLMVNGFKREAVEVLRSHAKLLKRFGNDCMNLEAKQDYFIQTYNILNDALNILNEILIDSVSLHQSALEVQNVSLPIQRELIETKLEISKLLTDILEVYLNEVKSKNEENFKKNQLVKIIENFVKHEENLNNSEEEWVRLLIQAPDLLTMYLVSCHTLSIKLKSFKANTLYLIGRAYRLIAELKANLKKTNLNDSSSSILHISTSISKWNPIINEIIRSQQSSIDDSSNKQKIKLIKSTGTLQNGQQENIFESRDDNNSNDGNVNILTDRGDFNFADDSNLSNIADQEILKNLLYSVNSLEAQGIECLLQAQNLALQIDDKQLGRSVAYELIECIGRLDVNLCSQYIALYQSFSSSIEAEKIIQKSSLNPKNSLLTGYLNQLKFYQRLNTTQNTLNSPIIKQLLELTKSKFNAIKCLTINSNHFNYAKDLPSNYIFLVLQHNENKNELFATILDRSKSGAGSLSKASKAPNSNSGSSRASAIKIKTEPFELNYLKQQWKEWKSNLQSFNLKLEFQLNNDLIKKQNSSSSNNSFEQTNNDFLKYYLDPTGSKYDEMKALLNDLENKFEFLINSTEIYLKEISNFAQNYFNSVASDLSQQLNGKTTSKPTDKLIILADLDLLEFPLESLKVFYNNTNLSSISRDYSLQFFASRFMAPKENPDSVKDDKKRDKSSKANPKQTQAPPANLEPLPEYATTIDSTRVKYLIDLYNETSSCLSSELTPLGSFKRITQQYAQICSKWDGLSGLDHTPSLGECENLLFDSSCLLFTGTERFLSYFSSNRIASLNLNDCKLIFANDMAQTSKSYSRLGKEDVLRNSSELDCENGLEATILLSLTGVRCIMSNQWSTNIVDNSDKFQTILKEFLENRNSSGEILRNKMSPHLKVILENMKKEEDKKQALIEKKDKKPEANKKETKVQVANTDLIEESEQLFDEENSKEAEETAKKMELIQKLSMIRKENLNMVCYGLPDVYIQN